MARLLIVSGLVLVGAGLLVGLLPKLPWLGRLPGDVFIQRGRFTLFFPLTTSLLVSVLLTLVFWLLNQRR